MLTVASWLKLIVERYDTLFNIPRVGWCQRGVHKSEAEDIGRHTLITAVISLCLCEIYRMRCGEIDCERVISMALIHDLPEALIGNIAGDVRRVIPNFREIEIEKLREILRESPRDLSSSLVRLFKEYRECQSIEAKIVTLSDKLATLIRAVIYAESGYPAVKDLIRFYRDKVIELSDEVKCSPVREEVLKVVNHADGLLM